MNASQTTKSVGGVARIVLHFATAVRPIDWEAGSQAVKVAFDDTGIPLTLKEYASTLDEQLSVEQGLVAVRHTLTAVMRRRDALLWLDAEQLRRLAEQGTIAEVVLMDGRRLLVGWSERFGACQPLKLASMVSHSGKAPDDEPTVTMVLNTTDTAFALPIL